MRRRYRRTDCGGVDVTYVFKIENDTLAEVLPKIRQRSKSGKHGEDEWWLPNGKYLVVDVSRSNNVTKPYNVVVWCYNVEDGTVTRRELASFISDNVDIALIRAKNLAYQC